MGESGLGCERSLERQVAEALHTQPLTKKGR